jgi:hypothetical protein
VTSWAFSKAVLLLLASFPAYAEMGVVNGIGAGRDVPEATAALLRTVVTKNFREPAALPLVRSVLQFEVIPNASSFVQSYRILDSGKSKTVNLSANVDLEVVRALISLTPESLSEAKGVKALVVVKGAPLAEEAADKTKALNPYLVLEAAGKERFARRGFTPGTLTENEIREAGEDAVSSPEFLRGLGAKSGARLALGISSKYELFENENSHNKEPRLVISATLVDVKAAAVLARETVTAPSPKSRKEQYALDLQRVLLEEGKDLFHEIFVDSGKKVLKTTDVQDFSILRLVNPPSAALVAKFRVALEQVKEIRSLVEYGISRGALDYSLKPVMSEAGLTKILKGLSSEEFVLTIEPNAPVEGQVKAPLVAVKLAAKEAAPQEVPGAKKP